jgi:hypothetical protein
MQIKRGPESFLINNLNAIAILFAAAVATTKPKNPIDEMKGKKLASEEKTSQNTLR